MLVVFVGLGVGCTSASMRHYFASANADDPAGQLTFYRVKVDGRSFLVTSTFQSGFYDAGALHRLFGEVKKPESGETTRSATLQLRYDPVRGTLERVGPDERLTFIYGANADAIADQVQAFATSDADGQRVARLLAAGLGGDVLEGSAASAESLERTQRAARALTAKLGEILAAVPDADTQDKVRTLLLQAAQEAARRAGSAARFDSADLGKGFTQAEAAYESLSR
jgi:hypothetical protein